MVSRRAVVTIAMLSLVVLAGCSGAGGGGGDSVGLSSDGADAGAPATASGGSDGGGASGGDAGSAESGGGTPAAQSAEFASETVQSRRALIRTAQVTLEVSDHDGTQSKLATMARSHGGFVAESSETQHRRDNRTWTTGRLVIRVPSDAFGPAFESVKASGTVLHAESQTTDVSDQLVDLEARLRNLRAQRDRLRTLYEQANETDDVLQVGDRLAEVQERIERLEAQRQSLEDRVAYSTITIEIREPEPERETPTPTPEPPKYHETPLYQAFTASIGGVFVALKTAAVTLAYALPYLVVIGLPLGVAGAIAYRRR
ncbi:DUF4349 domain-containing protein [Halorarius litoreus]|uniref:DUF4349 domain-containing protein n=1 Tax=Halorarius litoreus TaxID=2962676 RepID=UPI0020CD2195|nr:DUF4349 domain-containing protein [Halorarius litoreus]